MDTTVKCLYKSFVDDCIPDITVLHDYFGRHNIKDDNIISIIFGVYKGLYMKGITYNLLYKCFIRNKLDDLIHKKYKYRKSGYYNDFVKRNIVIGQTYFDLKAPDDDDDADADDNDDKDADDNDDKDDKFQILDDNHCPSCNSNNYYDKNYINDCPPDCPICCKMICKACSYYDDNEGSYVCYQCTTSSLKNNIKQKLSQYKRCDINKFGREGNVSFEDITQLLKKQNFVCYVCDEMVITSKWKPFCCYQFSVDRIDNKLPHDRTNVLISCYYCNCRHHPEFNQDYKICNAGCHTARKILPLRGMVSDEKINRLLLQ